MAIEAHEKLTCSDRFEFHAFGEAFLIATCGTSLTLQFVDDTIGLFDALIVFLVLNAQIRRLIEQHFWMSLSSIFFCHMLN